MKVVGLISGGKDSTFNLMHCVAHGHEIVALVNLYSPTHSELDSYMYQTVGSEAVCAIAQALDLPLYTAPIIGHPLNMNLEYEVVPKDEVEDLYNLLVHVKSLHPEINAVSVGAIESSYQTFRVQNVCKRLALEPLAYLWKKNQERLLQSMIDCNLDSIIIKVAAMGLDQSLLGHSLSEIKPIMIKLSEKYGLNICGEGGEYESFTLDCPLFKKKIVIDQKRIIHHSDDAVAPVAYLRIEKFHLEEKNILLVGLSQEIIKKLESIE